MGYTSDIVDQFRGWEAGKSRYLWERRAAMVVPHLPASGRVLDAGCGDLATIAYLSRRRPDLEFFGSDLGRPSGPRCVRADVRMPPFRDGRFACVLLLAVIEHVPDHGRLVAEAGRLLAPGGVVLLTTPNPLYGIPMAIAGRIGLKYREGYDNGISLDALERLAAREGLVVEESVGFLASPFPAPLLGVERALGRRRRGRRLLLNQFLKARKPGKA